MKHVVAKSALKTLLGAVIVILVAFAVFSFGFPGKMASILEDMGSYSLATRYAGLAYTYSKTTENLARCLDDSIFAENDEDIVKYGDLLLESSDFEEYAEGRSAATGYVVDYSTFVYGRLAIAKYNLNDKDGALETAVMAMRGVTGFPINNTYAILAIQAVRTNDTVFCQKLKPLIEELSPTLQQQNYYNIVLSIL